MASNPIVKSAVPTPFSKKIRKSYRIPKLPKKIEAAVIQSEKTNFEETLPNSNEIVPKSDEILPNVNKKKTTDYEVQKFLADIDLGAKYFCVFSPLIPLKREKAYISLLSCIFFERSVFNFQFLKDKISNYIF
jgi:hypothetical protein